MRGPRPFTPTPFSKQRTLASWPVTLNVVTLTTQDFEPPETCRDPLCQEEPVPEQDGSCLHLQALGWGEIGREIVPPRDHDVLEQPD